MRFAPDRWLLCGAVIRDEIVQFYADEIDASALMRLRLGTGHDLLRVVTMAEAEAAIRDDASTSRGIVHVIVERWDAAASALMRRLEGVVTDVRLHAWRDAPGDVIALLSTPEDVLLSAWHARGALPTGLVYDGGSLDRSGQAAYGVALRTWEEDANAARAAGDAPSTKVRVRMHDVLGTLRDTLGKPGSMTALRYAAIVPFVAVLGFVFNATIRSRTNPESSPVRGEAPAAIRETFVPDPAAAAASLKARFEAAGANVAAVPQDGGWLVTADRVEGTDALAFARITAEALATARDDGLAGDRYALPPPALPGNRFVLRYRRTP